MSDAVWRLMLGEAYSNGETEVRETITTVGEEGEEGGESGKYTVVFSNCRAGPMSFCHDWTSARRLCIHYGGRLSRRSS